MGILKEDRTGLYYVTKDKKILASFKRVTDAKKFWKDYQAGKVKAPKSNDIDGSKKAKVKRRKADSKGKKVR